MSNQQNTDVKDHAIEMGEALEALKKCPNFKKLILEGYLEQKVLASVSLLAVPQIKDGNHRPGVMEDLIAASNLQYFMQMVEQSYHSTKDPVLSDEEKAELEALGEQGEPN